MSKAIPKATVLMWKDITAAMQTLNAPITIQAKETPTHTRGNKDRSATNTAILRHTIKLRNQTTRATAHQITAGIAAGKHPK